MRATDILDLVQRLLAHEAAESRDPEALLEAAERVSDMLRRHLSKRIGQEGFRMLLARALTLTIPQFPHLSSVRIETDGTLAGLRQAARRTPENGNNGNNNTMADAVAGAEALIAQFLGLLITFIGEELTLRLLSTVWPEFSLDGANDREVEDS